MNLILERSEQMRLHTDMRAVFSAIPGVCETHDWLICNIECNWYPDERIPFGSEPILIAGHDLLDAISKHEIQFCWAVFCALPRGTRPALSSEPFADGNPSFWTGSPRPQLKESLLEIVCFDSTLTLLMGASEKIAAQFRSHFADALDLDEQNAKRMQA